MVDLLLINPNHQALIRAVAQTTVGPPLGLGYLAAGIERLGASVEILDANAERLSEDAILERVDLARPAVVGLTASTPTLHLCTRLADGIKARRPATPVLFGGVHPTVLPEEVLTGTPSVDYVLRGEADESLPHFLEEHLGDRSVEDTPGLAYRDGAGAIQLNALPAHVELDSLPIPARHLLPMDRYWTPDAGRFTGVLAMRGCPASCTYCDVPILFGRGIRRRSPARVVEEMGLCVDDHGVRLVSFFDDTFTYGRSWVLELCDALIAAGLHRRLRWICLTRVDIVDRELLQAMRDAGCTRVEFGIESGDPALLRAMKKGIDPTQVREAFHAAREVGLSTMAFVMLGYPGETEATIDRTEELLAEADPDYLQASFATPYPGTELYDLCVREKLLTTRDWSRYLFLKQPVIHTQQLNTATLMARHRALNRNFFLRPRHMLRLLRLTLRGADPRSMTRAACIGLRNLARASLP